MKRLINGLGILPLFFILIHPVAYAAPQTQGGFVQFEASLSATTAQIGDIISLEMSMINPNGTFISPIAELQIPEGLELDTEKLGTGIAYNFQDRRLSWQPSLTGRGKDREEATVTIFLTVSRVRLDRPEQRIEIAVEQNRLIETKLLVLTVGSTPSGSLSINPPQALVGEPVQLTAITEWNGANSQVWTLRDDWVLVSPNPTVRFPKAGEYDIQLQYSTPFGSYWSQQSITVLPASTVAEIPLSTTSTPSAIDVVSEADATVAPNSTVETAPLTPSLPTPSPTPVVSLSASSPTPFSTPTSTPFASLSVSSPESAAVLTTPASSERTPDPLLDGIIVTTIPQPLVSGSPTAVPTDTDNMANAPLTPTSTAPVATAIESPTRPPAQTPSVIVTANIYLRGGPSQLDPVLGFVLADATFMVRGIDKTGNWFYGFDLDHPDQLGWIGGANTIIDDPISVFSVPEKE